MPTDPFPGYLILEGMATALRKLGCRPLSDERYFNEDMSVVLAEDAAGKRHWLLYNKRSNDVTEFPGEKVA